MKRTILSGHVRWILPAFLLFFVCAGLSGEDQQEAEVDRTIELKGKEYRFVPEEIRVKAGRKIRILFTNEGTISHDFHIKELDFQTEPIQPGDSVSYTFTAPTESTTLHFECKVAGHGPAGMKGTISVQADGAGSSGSSTGEHGDKSESGASSAGDRSENGEGMSHARAAERSFHKRMAERRSISLKDGWGAIEGTVVLDGERPEPYENPGSEAFKKQCGFDGAFKVHYVNVHEKTNGVRDTLVYVKKLEAGRDELLPPENARIVQHHCRFHPSVQVVRSGGALTLENSDPAVHNFNYKPTKPLNSTKGNLVQKSGKDEPKKDRIKIDTPDVYTSQCNVHPWMNGLFLAIDHSGYDVTGKKGQFRIQLPPGQYELRIRHYTLKKAKTVKVTVPEGEVRERDITLSF